MGFTAFVVVGVMTDKNQDINNLGHIKAGGGDTLVDQELSIQCMESTMSYYMTLRRIIDRKLVYAHKATLKRISELEANADNVVKIQKYQGLNRHLNDLGAVLEEAQIGVEELERMNEVFHLLPGKIKLYYDHLVSLDKELVELIEEISSAEYLAAYKRAQRVIDMVQDGKNILSGRSTREEYADPGLRKILTPIERELKDMGGRRKDFSVLPDGRLIRDL